MSLVSIVIPIYNCAEKLSACLDSIIVQTYKNLDILLIDDGSIDDSYSLCLKYKEKDNRIRVFHHENQGVSFTRNVGIDNASGDFIMFVDADDTVLPDMVEKYVSAATQNIADIVIGGLLIYRKGNMEESFPPIEINSPEKAVSYIVNENGSILGYAPNKMYRNSLLRENGIRFPENIPVQEDLLFFLSVVEVARGITTIQYAGYNYDFSGGDKKAEYSILLSNQCRIIDTAKKYSSIDLLPAKKRLGNLLTEGLMLSKSKLSLKLLKQYVSIEGLKQFLDPSIMDSSNSKIIVWLTKHNWILLLYFYISVR